MQLLQPKDRALLRRIGLNDAGLRSLAIKLGRPRPAGAGSGGGFPKGRAEDGKIDGHQVR